MPTGPQGLRISEFLTGREGDYACVDPFQGS